MRINPSNTAAAELALEQSAQKVTAQKAAQSSQTDGGDRATLSSDTASVQSLTATALNSPEIRQSKVDSLREAVNNGTYQLDPTKIAASIVDEQA